MAVNMNGEMRAAERSAEGGYNFQFPIEEGAAGAAGRVPIEEGADSRLTNYGPAGGGRARLGRTCIREASDQHPGSIP